jgi:YHS domain-containing protein
MTYYKKGGSVMKRAKILGLILTMILCASGYVLGENKQAKSVPQTNCPVMGGEINKEVYTDYQGKRVYFCCPGCIPEFKKDPAKYIKKLEDEGVTFEKIPTASSQDKSSQNKPQGCGDCGGCS